MTGMDYSQFEFTVLFIQQFGLRSDIPVDKYYTVLAACYFTFTAYDKCFTNELKDSSLVIINNWLLAHDALISKRLNSIRDK